MDAVAESSRDPLRLNGAALPIVGRARVYVCGITPYDVTHLGHASTYLWTDLAVRVWRSVGVRVEVARNITDVDDAMFAEARRVGMPYDQVAAIGRFAFDRSMAALGVRPPDHEPTARASVIHVIELGQALLAAGHAYLRNGTVYARTRDAAARVGLGLDEAVTLAAEFNDDPADPQRDDPLDVAVWRAGDSDSHSHSRGAGIDGSRDIGQSGVSWPSPWGPGRPGWHAECAAMVLNTFGSGIDLHAGGEDLRFPHHAVESLLAERATGVAPFARAWLQVGSVRVDGIRMSKSLGNLTLVDDLLDRHTPAAVRLLCLARRWQDAWDYHESALTGVEDTLDQLYVAAGRARSAPDPAAAVDAVDAALRDDLDVPRALAIALDSGGAGARRLIDVLGLA
ncbi:cysteine--tRNA ligase [Frankia sp. Cas4]|uniref:cysteine--tRNA ligase n=1 Tax=Frankia sp. Cas4 TaxID=3073927 RepID=UPI002AD2C3AC|nr:cysteine--tRNA ligase [Frankia sp. Cas4]